ncbi:MAG TPA: hypothetical protein VE261_06135 [Gaiellaceae bacterium]|nr:hypothetical protein [Gaiellaceae bacterium]
MGLFGELFEDLGLSGLLTDGRWVTLKNGKRIKLDGDGRIVAGLPTKYHGVHVADFSRVSAEKRELLAVDCDELATCHGCQETFKTKDHAYRALLDANPELDALRQSEFGAYDLALLKWLRNSRRGPKPRTTITDGRLDAINEYYDLRGASKVASFTEAVYHAIPSSRRWRDLEPRLGPLEEATGIKLNLPTEALKLDAAKLDAEQCRADVDARIAALFKDAREAPPPAPASEEEAPF